VTKTTTMLIPGRIEEGNERLLLQSMRLFFLKKSCWRSSLYYTHCTKKKAWGAHTDTHRDIQTNPGLFMSSLKSSQLSSHITSSSSGNRNPTKDKNSTQSVRQSVTNKISQTSNSST
jgi:hypothetical protein